MNDPVNHPGHYTSGKIEVIDFLEDQGFPYHLGNAVKYISRAGKKESISCRRWSRWIICGIYCGKKRP